jgi:hypothetical protein
MKMARIEERIFIFKQTNFCANDDGMQWNTNWCSAAVSISEKLPEDRLVRPKRVAILMTF